MLKEIANTSKKDQKIARAQGEWVYERNGGHCFRDIYDAYERPSVYKVRAFEYCKDLCARLNGFDLRITGRNCMKFSVCFKFFDPEDGQLCYAYITRDYDRFCHAAADDVNVAVVD